MVPSTEIESRSARVRMLAVLAVLVVALAGVVSRPAHAAAQEDVEVKNYSFTPADLVIDVGTEVVWTATEGDHTVTSEGGSFDGLIAQDYEPHSFSHTFTKPGRYTYYCGFHRYKRDGMTGVVQVKDPSGAPTTTEPPTTTTTWSPPTTTTSAPATTTTAPPPTATTAAPTATTSAPLPTSTSTAPAATTSAPPATTPRAAPPATSRPGQAGAAKGTVAAPAATPTPSAAPAAAEAPTTTLAPPGDLTPVGDATVAAPAPAVRRQAGAASPSPSGAPDGGGSPALVLLLGAGGLVALAGVGTAIWHRRR